jgi:hypothetical protein
MKAIVEAETERLHRRILEVKNSKSEYFLKVIRLPPADGAKGKKEDLINRSALLRHPANDLQENTI